MATTYYTQHESDGKWIEIPERSFDALTRAGLVHGEHVRLVKAETPRFALLLFTGMGFDVVEFKVVDETSIEGTAVAGFLSPFGIKPPKEDVEAVMLKFGLTWFNYQQHATQALELYDASINYQDPDDGKQSTMATSCRRCGGPMTVAIMGMAVCPHCGAMNWF